MALNGLFYADVPLRNYSLTHSLFVTPVHLDKAIGWMHGHSCGPK